MSEVKIPQELLNIIADINFDEIQSQSYSPSHFRNWLCAWHEKIKIELYDFANNHELYEQGRADAIELLSGTSVAYSFLNDEKHKAYDKGYQQGKADGAREFAEWFAESSKVSEPIKEYIINRWLEDFAEWQKGAENEV